MELPKVEFYTEDIDGVEYLNVGFVFHVPDAKEPVRCVLGAFSGEVDQNGMRIIKGLVEEAAAYMQGIYSGEITVENANKPQIEVVKSELILP